MANVGFGLQLVRTLHGSAGTALTMLTYIPSTNATALASGDPVMLLTTANLLDGVENCPYITQAISGDVILGVVLGFEPDGSHLLTSNYRAASVGRYVSVCIDPDAIYQIQEDGVSSTVTAAQIAAMYNIPLTMAVPNAQGQSTVMATSASATQSASDLKIVGVRNDYTQVAGSTAGVVLEVMILSPAIKATSSQG